MAAAALALLSIAAARWMGAAVLEDIPHVEDEFAYLWQAEVMAVGRITLPSPPEPASFPVPFVVDHQGQRFGKYPPGWPALLAVGVAGSAPGWVNPLLAGLAVWLTYLLGKRLAGRAAGLLAAVLVATSPMLLMLSGTMMSHMLTVVLTLGWMLAWFDLFVPGAGVVADRRGRWLRIAAGGGSLGLMLLTRPLTALMVALPFAIHAVVIVVRRRDRAFREVAALGLTAAGVALLLPAWQWALTGNPSANLYALYWPYDRLGFGLGIGPLEEGHTLHQAWINTRQSLFAWQHDLFGWPYLSWIFIPVGLWLLRRRVDAWLCAAVFPALVIGYMAYWVGSWLLGPRYFVEALPGLAAISAGGMTWFGGWAARSMRGARFRRALAATMIAALLLLNVGFYLPIRLGGLRGLFGIDRAALEAFESASPGAAVVIVHRNPYWHGYGNLLTLTPPFRWSDLVLLYERGSDIDERVAALFADGPVYHYYPDEPGRLYPAPRPG